jgi:hypothetical protein
MGANESGVSNLFVHRAGGPKEKFKIRGPRFKVYPSVNLEP